MNKNYEINSVCLRYVVPFRYSETFDVAAQAIEAQMQEKSGKEKTLWEKRVSTLEGSESDLYAYIRNEFRFDDSDKALAENKLGGEWILRGSAESSVNAGHGIKQLCYFPQGINYKKANAVKGPKITEGLQVFVSNVGLYLFRNGVGFVWYELETPWDEKTSSQLETFQNVVRELNRGGITLFWEMSKAEPECGIAIADDNGYKTYYSPFLFGQWINELVNFIDVSYFAQRKSTYNSLVRKSIAAAEGIEGTIINKKVDTEEPSQKATALPDKAILFTYASFDNRGHGEEAAVRNSMAFHIANGYKASYHFSDETAKEIKHPYSDVLWYATKEGAAYLAWPGEDNREVFNSLIPSKFKADYFVLFIKALFQSFSLLIYAERIQKEISAVRGKYMEESMGENVLELFEEINMFLTKSMATSVSHIHHQSEFYVYLKEQLRIHEDVESVTSGLQALDAIHREQRQVEERRRLEQSWQEEQRREHQKKEERIAREDREKKSDEKLQAIMGLFALLGISSALLDCFDLISKFDPIEGDFWKYFGTTRYFEIVFFVIIGVISLIAVYFSVKAIIRAFKNEKEEK